MLFSMAILGLLLVAVIAHRLMDNSSPTAAAPHLMPPSTIAPAGR